LARRSAFAVLILLLASVGAAERSPRLRVGTSDDYAPFALRGRGFDIDVGEALARDLGVPIEWVRFRWPELRALMAAGQIDVAMSGITWRPERAVIGRMTRAVAQGGPCVVGDPRAATIAVNRGGVLERWARQRFGPDRVVAVDDNRTLPTLLFGGAARAFVTDSFELTTFRHAPDLAVSCEPARDRKVYWIAPGRADELGPRFDRWLAANEPRLRVLRARWLGAPSPRDEIDELVDQLARRFAFMPAVAAWKRAHGAAIADPERERAVLDGAAAAAHAHGLEPAAVRELFAVQIDIAKSVQGRPGAEAPALDLQTEIRPTLSRIGERIIDSLAIVAPLSPDTLGEDRLAPLGELLNDDERARLVTALCAVRRTTP